MKKNKLLLIVVFFISLSCKQFSDEVQNKHKDSNTDVKSQKNMVEPKSIGNSQRAEDETLCNQDFDTFFKRFASDSVFQKQRVKFPLKWFFFEDSYEKLSSDILEKSDYNFIDFREDKDAMKNESGKYEIIIEKGDHEVNYLLKGYDNGIYLSYKFELFNSCWFMVEIKDQST